MRSTLRLATWIAGSFICSLALLAPAKLDAIVPTTAPSAGLASAKINASGADLSVELDGRSTSPTPIAIKPDAQLSLEFFAKNTTDRNIDVQALISISSSRAPSAASRVIALPTLAWQQRETFTLLPGETKTIPLRPTVHLNDASKATVQLSSGIQFIQPFTLTVKS